MILLAAVILFGGIEPPTEPVAFGSLKMNVFGKMTPPEDGFPGQTFILGDRHNQEATWPTVDIVVIELDSTVLDEPEGRWRKIFDKANQKLDLLEPPHGKPGKRQTQRRTPHQVRGLFKGYANWPIVKQLGSRYVFLTELYIEPHQKHLSVMFFKGKTGYIVDAFWDGPNQPTEQVENAQFEAMANSISLR